MKQGAVRDGAKRLQASAREAAQGLPEARKAKVDAALNLLDDAVEARAPLRSPPHLRINSYSPC